MYHVNLYCCFLFSWFSIHFQWQSYSGWVVLPVVRSTISESDRTGTRVAVVSATDEENNPLTYSFVGSYPEFMIDQRTGIIRLRTQVDREEAPTIDILVMASDGQFTSTATVLVTIEDVNEMPLFKNPKYE